MSKTGSLKIHPEKITFVKRPCQSRSKVPSTSPYFREKHSRKHSRKTFHEKNARDKTFEKKRARLGLDQNPNFPARARLELEQAKNFPARARLELEQIFKKLARARLDSASHEPARESSQYEPQISDPGLENILIQSVLIDELF